MLKKKLNIAVITLFFIVSMIMPIAKADNETNTATNTAENTNEQSDTTNSTDSATNTSQAVSIKEGDVFVFQNEVTIDYLVDGNVFVFANNVTIDSQIGGDVIVYGNNLTVTENGYILGNLFALVKNINIKGIIYDLYASSNNVTIDGYIGRDIRVTSENLSINGVIGRNAFVRSNNINFAVSNEEQESSNNGYIAGSLDYSAPNELSIPEKAVVGDVSYSPVTSGSAKSASIESYLISLGSTILLVILIWFICLKLTPKFLNNATNYISSKKILPVILTGILTPIVLTLVSMLLLLISITVPIGLLLLLALVIIACIGTSITIISINNLVCNKLKINKTIGIFGCLILTTIILWAVSLIPYVGSILGLIFIIVGMGIVVYNLLTLNKTYKNEKIDNSKNAEKVEDVKNNEKADNDKSKEKKAKKDKKEKNNKKDNKNSQKD